MTGSKAEFVRETGRRVEELGDRLVTIEDGADRETVDELFRLAHTLKSNCGAAGLESAADAAHAVEEFLEAVRSRDVRPTPAVLDAALAVVDDLGAIVEEVGEAGSPETDPGESTERLRAALESASAPESHDGTGTGPAGGDDGSAEPVDLADVAVPEPDGDVSAEEALERASVFDDLEGLSERIDDADEFAGLEGGGSFDEVLDDDDAAGAGPGAEGTGSDPGGTATGDPGRDRNPEDVPSAESAGTPETGGSPVDPADEFQELRADVERPDPETLQRELEAVEFGEFDDEDTMGIEELVAVDPGEADADAGEATAEADAGGVEPEVDPGTSPGEDGPEAATGSPGPEEAELANDDRPLAAGDFVTEPGDVSAGDGSGDAEGSVVEAIASLPGETDDEPAGSEDGTRRPGRSGLENEPTGANTANDGTGDPEAAEDTGVDDPAELAALIDGEFDPAAAGWDPVEGGADAGQEGSGSGPTAGERRSGAGDGPAAGTGDGTSSSGPPGSEPEASETPEATDRFDLETDAAGSGTPADPDLASFERDEATAAFVDSFGEEFGTDRETDAEAEVEGASTIAAALGDAPEREASTAGGEITIDLATADDLLAGVERLITTRSALETEYDGQDPAVREHIDELRDVAARLEEAVTDARLVPLEAGLRGLRRTVRDVARETGKEVEFTVEGDDVELDRSIVDAIGDPLVHLVRNAVDHGIEPPEEREAAGKPPTGSVALSAERVRDRVVVEVSDDGRGIDADEVRERAVEAGLLDPETAAETSDETARRLVFRSGFSTTDEVTDVSGRGVGMDVVERVTADLDGDVEIDSEPGEGTTVRLVLPVSVAVEELLFVTTGGERFAIPAAVVDRVERVEPSRVDGDHYLVRRRPDPAEAGIGDPVETDGGQPTDPFEADRSSPEGSPDRPDPGEAADGSTERYPLVDLGEALSTGPSRRDPGIVVTVREDVRRIAIRVDEVGDWRKVVVSPYEDLLGDVDGVAGGTIVGDGTVVNVIDVETLAGPGGRTER